MTNIFTFLGCTLGDASQIIPYTEKFDVLYDDGGEMKLITKETYSTEADEDMPEFKYKYVLNCMDLTAFGSQEKSIVIQCLMCPLPEYVNKKVLSENEFSKLRKYSVNKMNSVYKKGKRNWRN